MSATQEDGFSAFSQSAAAVEARLRVSALADGELDAAEAHKAVDAVLASPDLEAYWMELHRAGDCVRSEEVAGVGDGGAFLRRFAARFADEPTIIGPRRDIAARSRSWLHAGLPGASIAAALLVVGWMVMPLDRTGGARQTVVRADAAPVSATTVATTVAVAVAAPVTVDAAAVQSVDSQQLADYLAAHQQLASSALRGPGLQAASFNTSRLDPAQSAQPR